MGDPSKYLPTPFEEDRLCGFLRCLIPADPVAVKLLPKSGDFHLIYVLTYPRKTVLSTFEQSRSEIPQADGTRGDIDLILRVSGDHIRSHKTENEAAVISWLRTNTSIPVPVLLSYSAKRDNTLGCEYMLFIRSPGVNARDVFDTFSEQQRAYLLDQLIDVLVQLHKFPFKHVGGLKLGGNSGSAVVPGPVVEEHFWFDGELEEYWPTTLESYETLNVIGPFDGYSDFVCESIEKYIHAIEVHDSLTFMRDSIGRLRRLLDLLADKRDLIDRTEYRLAHKDLHFGNILVNPRSAQVTCVLDWEFAGVVPYQSWDPHKSFLAAREGEEGIREKRAFVEQFKHRCKELEVEYLLRDAAFTSSEQEKVHEVQNYLRAIVEVCPRGYRQELARSPWKESMLLALKSLEID